MAKKVDFYAEYDRLQGKVEGYSRKVERILDTFANESTALAVESGYEGKKYFRIDDYPDTKKLFEQLQLQSANDIRHVIINGATALWADSNFLNDKFAQSILGDKAALDEYKRYFNNNAEARDAFLKRQRNGLNLSQRIWRIQDEFKEGFEGAITVAIQEGTSAAQLSRSIRQYLREPDKLFRRIGMYNDKGELEKFRISKPALSYNPGAGMYRSSYRNAMRVAATEINMAYRQSDQLRWQQMDFIVGYEIKRSGHSYPCPICEALKGRYPKDFVWTGWHPWCYDEKSEILTDSGWKFFKDVCYCDKILSLNPETRSVEWVDIALYISRHHSGDMVHFHNNSLDCLVTPEHEMVYLNKSDGSIRKKQAVEFRKGHGAFYRSCEWVSPDVESIHIGNSSLYFDLFCEFMGYWLSDGSTIRNSQICIAQMDGDTNKDKIVSCIERLGFKVSTSKDKVNFYSRDLCAYLKQFGLCSDKFVPCEVKNASKRQIQIFLDAFISCDGYTRTSKSFIGSRGTLCVPKNPEKVYYTTSQKIASDIGELILKVGKRPSYHITPTKGKVSHFKNGDYASNFDSITIRECVSVSASEFKKDIVHYDGTVYDVTLSKNHIMYIRRNGKCFWGSNCRCRSIPILKTEEEMDQDDALIMSGKEPLAGSVNSIGSVPNNYKQWIVDNQDRIVRAKEHGTLPYFLKDNSYSQYFEPYKQLNLAEISSLLGSDRDTLSRFTVKDGMFTSERQALHDKIIGDILSNGSTRTNTVYMLGGAPANGKSTLVDSGILPHPRGVLKIDPDAIKSMIPEYARMLSSGDELMIKRAAKFVHEESSALSKAIQSRLNAQNWDYVLDGVNDGSFEKLLGKLSEMRSGGRRIRADYVSLDTDLSIKLAIDRAKRTGRDVPMNFVTDMNREVSKLVPEIIEKKAVDDLFLWDTNINGKPRLILEMIDGKLKIHDQELYDAFLMKSKR